MRCMGACLREDRLSLVPLPRAGSLDRHDTPGCASARKRRRIPVMRWLLCVVAIVLCFGRDLEASFINYSAREVNVKVIYYGAPTARLAENLQYIYDKTEASQEGQDDLARDRDGANGLLRLPAERRPPRSSGLKAAVPPVHHSGKQLFERRSRS